MNEAQLSLVLRAAWATIWMVGVSGALALALGVPLGMLLVASARGGVAPRPILAGALGAIVNATRSTPFIILMVAVIPLTRAIVGTSIGTAAAIVPLTLAAIPFVARLAETALREVPSGLVEAAEAMGATPLQILTRVLLPEALPALVAAATLTFVNLIGYSAMAGAVGGGGLGDVGIRYGYQRFEPVVMLVVVVALIILVQAVQSIGDAVVRRIDRR
jgi:D-methionine transport system permease protein